MTVADRAEVIAAAAVDAVSGERRRRCNDIHNLGVNVFWKASLGFCCCCLKNYNVRTNGQNRGRWSHGTSSGKAKLWLIQ